MKNKLFKHLNLPEMYNIDVGDGNKIYVEVGNSKGNTSNLFLSWKRNHCRNEHH